jgi:hypothetical protein
MSGDARDFNNIKTRALIKHFFVQSKAPKEIHAILKETVGKYAPSYATIKNVVIFPPVLRLVLDDTKQ